MYNTRNNTFRLSFDVNNLYPLFRVSDKEHLDFMNNLGADQFDFQPFTQLNNDYSGYQSLTDVPKSSVYTEDVINIQVYLFV